MHGKAHLARRDHVPPRGEADLGHVVAVGAGHGALTTEGAGVYSPVHHVVAHDYADVIVYLARHYARELAVMPEPGAALYALFTAAPDASFGFRPRLLRRIASALGQGWAGYGL